MICQRMNEFLHFLTFYQHEHPEFLVPE